MIIEDDIKAQLLELLGPSKVRLTDRETEYYRSGWRTGKGSAAAVVFPSTLLEYWNILNLCVQSNCIIIMQAANTGLTEGSTPQGNDYDRPVVIINTLAMNTLYLLGDGEQAVGFPGTTLHQLESALATVKRAPHSVIGSSSLGASVVGGIANNSGGALVKRGPAYTELSLFAQVDSQGNIHLINHLGIDLGDSPEAILTNLEQGRFDKTQVATDKQASSAADYTKKIREVNADTPSRFNADTSRLFEASGCAGKLAVFAVRVDSFPIPKEQKTFYIGTNDASTFTHLRKHILTHFQNLPEVGEYLHKDIFDIAQKYGKDTFLSIEKLGTQRMPKLFAMKGKVDAYLRKVPLVPNNITDRLMQWLSYCFPEHLPKRMLQFRERYEHYLILKMSDGGIEEASRFLSEFFKHNPDSGSFFECTPEEEKKVYLHRFAAAGAAIRYQTLYQKKVGEILALDIALRRNDETWVEELPEHIAQQIDKSLYYGHFFCHVFHQDYVLKAGSDADKVKKDMLSLLDSKGAKYPAEHNVGHLYEAEDGLQKFYKELDPTNTFNPGVGKMDKHKRNCSCNGGLL